MTGKWGHVPKCPACEKSVYPVEQVRDKIIQRCILTKVGHLRFLLQTENLFTDNAFSVRCEAAGKEKRGRILIWL